MSASSRTHVLHPGDVALAEAGERLETLLGSCVAVILTDPRRSVGAMCHIVHAPPPGLRAGERHDTSYADAAMREMFSRLVGVGIMPRLCEAYVYGGGNMFPDLYTRHHVGASNLAWVDDFLHEQRIRVLARSTGSECYRKVSWTVGPSDPQVDAVPVVPGQAAAGEPVWRA